MASVIHKHPLIIDRVNHVRVPSGTRLIHFDFQNRTPTVWSLKPVDFKGWMEFELRIVGTGWEFEPILVPAWHVGTALIDQFVWHLFVTDVREAGSYEELTKPAS